MREAVAHILADAGLADDGALTRTLESFGALCPAEAPAPTGALAELLAHGTAAPGGVASSRSASRAAEAAVGKLSPQLAPVVPFPVRKRHRGAAISAAVLAGVGLSASGVAALGGVDYSANAPQADARSAVAPQLGADSSAQSQTSSAADAVVHQAQAFAAAAGGSSAAHEDPSAAPSAGGSQDAAASPDVVRPSTAVGQAVAEAARAVAPAAAHMEDALYGVAHDVGDVVAPPPAPRHRADPAPSRGRHVAQEAAATAQAIAAPFASAPVKEAIAVASGAGQRIASAAAGALGHQQGNNGGRALAAVGARH